MPADAIHARPSRALAFEGDEMREWWAHARARPVVARATKTSAVVGTLLVAINQGDALAAGGLAALSWSKVALTFLVPYAVSTSSSVASRREQAASTGDPLAGEGSCR